MNMEINYAGSNLNPAVNTGAINIPVVLPKNYGDNKIVLIVSLNEFEDSLKASLPSDLKSISGIISCRTISLNLP